MNRLCASWFVGLGLLTFVSQHAHGAAVASDDASSYSGGWSSGQNNGSGFGPWNLSTTGPNAGFFTFTSQTNGSSDGNIDTGASLAWGLYGNSGNESIAVRPFTAGGSNGSNILGTGEQFLISLDTGYIDNGSSDGISLQNSSGTNELQFLFTGGTTNYVIQIGSTSLTTSIPFTSKGMALDFTQGAANSWSLTISPNGGSPVTYTDTSAGSAPLAASDISQVQAFNNNAGNGGSNNFYVNSAQVIPEPGAGAALLGAFGILSLARRRRTPAA